jgi:hypothetical protein
LKIALRPGLVFLVFHINIFKNNIFVSFRKIFVESVDFFCWKNWYFSDKNTNLSNFFSESPKTNFFRPLIFEIAIAEVGQISLNK